MLNLVIIYNPGSIPLPNPFKIKTIAKAVNPAKVPPIVQDLKVSGTEIPPYFEITQNPESVGNDIPTPPAHIAKPTSTGEAPIDNATGPKIDDVVTCATVVGVWQRLM